MLPRTTRSAIDDGTAVELLTRHLTTTPGTAARPPGASFSGASVEGTTVHVVSSPSHTGTLADGVLREVVADDGGGLCGDGDAQRGEQGR